MELILGLSEVMDEKHFAHHHLVHNNCSLNDLN